MIWSWRHWRSARSEPIYGKPRISGTYAVARALNTWRVFPLRGKVPAIPSWAGGRGVLDATTDLLTVLKWWSGRYAGCNIGGRVPEAMFVLDIDPRNGGLESLQLLETRYGTLPPTLTTVSGRGDGGTHMFFRRPHGKLTSSRLGAGIDIKSSSGYVVLPPSVHPDSGMPYTTIEREVAATPRWLSTLICPEERSQPTRSLRPVPSNAGRSIADIYSSAVSWADILEPHGWLCLNADPDADGARWRHPAATSTTSASIKHEKLFVYSPNTPFEITEALNAHGYTRFRAYAILNHHGDMRAAARKLREVMRPQ